MAMGPNLLTMMVSRPVIMAEVSSHRRISTSNSLSELLMTMPTVTATTTIASTPPLLEKAAVRLLGTAFSTIISGLEPVEPVEAVTSPSTVWENAPSL